MDLQTLALATIIVGLGAAQYTLMAQAIRDLIRRPRVRGGNKMSWGLLILCVPIIGALLYSWMGPTSFLHHRSSSTVRQTRESPDPYASERQGPQPHNVTPLHPRPSSIRSRTTQQRPGLTQSRAHNTGATGNRVRRTGS